MENKPFPTYAEFVRALAKPGAAIALDLVAIIYKEENEG